MKNLKYVDFLGRHVHLVLLGVIAIIVLGLSFSLFTFINSYQEVVQSGMIASIGSIEFPR